MREIRGPAGDLAVGAKVSVDALANVKAVDITGISKGAGMIKPNMATMLGYVATDAKVPQPILDHLVKAIAPRFMRLEARFYVRGGIFTTVVAEHRKQGWSAPQPVALDAIASQPSVRGA